MTHNNQYSWKKNKNHDLPVSFCLEDYERALLKCGLRLRDPRKAQQAILEEDPRCEEKVLLDAFAREAPLSSLRS